MAVGVLKRVRRFFTAPALGRLDLGFLESGWEDAPAGEHRSDILARYTAQFLIDNAAVMKGRIGVAGDPSLLPEAVAAAARPFSPDKRFDCIVLIHALAVAHDPRRALMQAAAALAPGGVLLASLPGTAYDGEEIGPDLLWRFSPQVAEHMCAELPGDGSAAISNHGNVLSAVASVAGMHADHLRPGALTTTDAPYPVMVGIRVIA